MELGIWIAMVSWIREQVLLQPAGLEPGVKCVEAKFSYQVRRIKFWALLGTGDISKEAN